MEPKYKVGSWIMWKDAYHSFVVVSKILGYMSWTAGEFGWVYRVKLLHDSRYQVYHTEVIKVLTDEQAAIYLLEN